jgi:CspA family cold shock protein
MSLVNRGGGRPFASACGVAGRRRARQRDVAAAHQTKGRALAGAEARGEFAMTSGTVVSFDPARRYGFIHPAEGGRDVCVLLADIERAHLPPPAPGQAVDYDLSWDLAGTLIAINLRLREGAPR